VSDTPKIEKAAEFNQDPQGWQRLWTVEIKAAKEYLKDWHDQAKKVVERCAANEPRSDTGETRMNFFTANVQTMKAMLYGRSPSTEVRRRFYDPNDEPARIAATALERLLNTDIERDDDSCTEALEMALDDRLVPGFGSVRLRYEVETEEQAPVPAIQGECDACAEAGGVMTDCPMCGGSGQVELAPGYTPPPKILDEDVEVDYVHWEDELWSPCRNWSENRWRAWKISMTRDALHQRFDDVIGPAEVDLIALKGTQVTEDGKVSRNDPWARAEVWEIWSKEHKKVFWWAEGSSRILDVKDDPLGLRGFYPSPRPMFANTTTSDLIPIPDYVIAQDLYNEIDYVSTRITRLERAIKVVGIYDKNSTELKRIMTEACDLDMLPVDNFMLVAERGGLKGVVDWLPLEQFVAALDKLREYRNELIALLYQVTGMSDIMRGQSSKQATATEQAIKARFASTRMQAFQNEFARFASDILTIKAEIISKHWSKKTIVERANLAFLSDADKQMIPQALELIQSRIVEYRVEVKPDTIAMQDYAAIKQERGEMLTAMATFLQSSMPVITAAPPLGVMLFQMLQWAVAGFRGSGTIEAVIDQGVVQFQQMLAAKQNEPQQPPPEVIKAQADIQAAQEKAKLDGAKAQMDLKGRQIELGLKTQEAQMDLQMKRAEHDLSTKRLQNEVAAEALRSMIPEKPGTGEV
jgi:hypothetical protein